MRLGGLGGSVVVLARAPPLSVSPGCKSFFREPPKLLDFGGGGFLGFSSLDCTCYLRLGG